MRHGISVTHHCGTTGHTEVRCWEKEANVHMRPSNWKSRLNSNESIGANIEVLVSNVEKQADSCTAFGTECTRVNEMADRCTAFGTECTRLNEMADCGTVLGTECILENVMADCGTAFGTESIQFEKVEVEEIIEDELVS